MVTAWQIPQDPTGDLTLDPKLADQIKWGYRLFVNTPHEAPHLTGGGVACANCHLNAGQRERALPLVGITGMFPEYNNRAARLISLQDRGLDRLGECRALMRTRYAAFDHPGAREIVAWLDGQWKRIQEYEKKEGIVLSYHVLSVNNTRPGEPDLILAIEYKDYIPNAERLAEQKRIEEMLSQDARKMEAAAGERKQMRKVMGGMELQELKLK